MLKLLLLKIFVPIITVLCLIWIAEKVSTRFTGILVGLPIGTAIVLFFLGYENGIEFASTSAIWAINGLVAEILFVLCYYMGVVYLRKYSVISSIFLALVGFFASAFIIRYLPFNDIIKSSIFLLVFIIISIIVYKNN